MAGQAEQWFKLADQDGDGAVGGAEAVRFFTRSGLPQDVLGQVGVVSKVYAVILPSNEAPALFFAPLDLGPVFSSATAYLF